MQPFLIPNILSDYIPVDLGRFFSFLILYSYTANRTLGRRISPSQGCYLHTGHHKHRINAYTDIHDLSGIRSHDPSVRASEDSSCLRPRGYCDRPKPRLRSINTWQYYLNKFLTLKGPNNAINWSTGLNDNQIKSRLAQTCSVHFLYVAWAHVS
jgi:hypothetical protein